MWTIRAAVATGLWVAAAVLTFVFVISGFWLLLPFALAGGGGPVLYLFLIIIGLALAAHLLGRRAPVRPHQAAAGGSGGGADAPTLGWTRNRK